MQQTLWFIKSKRAQTSEDFETWVGGGQVIPTLNAFDVGDGREVVVIIEYPENVIGTITTAFGAKNYSNDQELREGSVVVYIDGTRVNDVRVYDEEIMQTVIQRWGTGGGNVPAIAYSIREDAKAENFSVNEIGVTNALQAHQPSANSHHAQTFILEGEEMSEEPLVLRDREGKAGGGKGALISKTAFTLATSNFHTLFPNDLTVRRLTPIECERLQGFPDDWTAGQADSSRYKQMGNAVAVPVVEWIIQNICDTF